MKKTILKLLAIAMVMLSINAKTVYADGNIFTDGFGKSFEYGFDWTYSKEDYGDGYDTYVFTNTNGQALQLAIINAGGNITYTDIENLCKESGGEYVYKGTFSSDYGNTWYIAEYKNIVNSCYGTASGILYRINIANSNNSTALALAKNIMNAVSEPSDKDIENAIAEYNQNNNRQQEALQAGLFEGLKTFIFVGAIIVVIGIIRKKKKNKEIIENKEKENTVDNKPRE